MQRRSFLSAILAAGFAPAYVGASVLMPVKKLVQAPTLYMHTQQVCAGDMIGATWVHGAGRLRIYNDRGVLLMETTETEGYCQATGTADRFEIVSPKGPASGGFIMLESASDMRTVRVSV